MLKARTGVNALRMLILFFGITQGAVNKVTLVVNFGGGAILHSQAVEPFKNVMTAMSNEKGFELTIMEKDQPSAQIQEALANLKNMDVVLFANIGENSFPNPADQQVIKDYLMSEKGRGIGFHATIDHHNYWPWWGDDLHNGSGFQGHGNNAFSLDVDPEIDNIPGLRAMWDDNNLGQADIIGNTEIYTLNVYPRGKEGVTMMQTVAPPNNIRASHDFTWHKTIGQGKYIFTCLGHAQEDFNGGWMQEGIWAWMRYLTGEYDIISGCMNPDAPNFNPEATEDDGSCEAVGAVAWQARAQAVSIDGYSLSVMRAHSIRITDVKGNTVFSANESGPRSYELSDRLESGIYCIHIGMGKNRISRKLTMY